MNYEKDMSRLRDFLTNGTKISVKLEFGNNDEYCFNSQVIGFKNHAFIIIDYPHKVIDDLIVRNLKYAKTIIRAKSNSELGHIIAFRTNILHIIMQPAPMIMLKVPHDYACKPIRKHYRFQFTAPVEININNRHYNGMLTDFSVSGCKISLNHEAFVELGAKVDVKINIFPEQESIISSTITNITKFKSEKIIGVFFNQQIPFDDRLQSAIFKYCYPDC